MNSKATSRMRLGSSLVALAFAASSVPAFAQDEGQAADAADAAEADDGSSSSSPAR